MADKSAETRDRSILNTRRRFLATSATFGSLAVAGCLGGDSDDGSGLSGEVRISGSSTVFPVSEAAGEEFQRENPDVNVSISSDGSTGGFEQFFLEGDSDINGASRPILEDEVERARDNGFEPIEIQCAGDALTAIVNNEAEWVDCMTIDELGQIWDPDAENELWSDINPDWPEEPFELYGPATTSGTFDYWTEEVIGKFRQIRDDFEGTEEDDIIAQGVEGNRYAHGYLPFAYYDNNPDSIKALEIDAGDGCTAPSLQAASEGSYPLARPIFWYVNSEKLTENEVLEPFIRFAIEISGDESIVADDIGYVPMNDQQVEDHLAKIDEATAN
ncbi:MAG: PstS family phosphate ABC transporter substrate-binding protein [Halobacteriota archaeon]